MRRNVHPDGPPGPLRAGARVGIVAGTLTALLVLSGCFATTKQVEMMETDMTQRSAWTDEQFETLKREVQQVRGENEALRVRLDDLYDQFARLGDEVSGRITELQDSDTRLEGEVRQAAQQTTRVSADQAAGREDMMARMNVVLDEVVKENKKLVERIDALESSAYTFGRMHEVKAGESLASIAKKYGVTAAAIADANGLSDANLIRAGQQLLIPGVTK